MKYLIVLLCFFGSEALSSETKSGYISSPNGAIKVEYQLENNIPIMEGDIEIDPAENKQDLAIKGAGKWLWFRKWPKKTIPYVIDPTIPHKQRIEWAINHISQKTGFKLIPRVKQRDYVYFKYNGKDGGCSSFVGRKWGKQYIRIPEWCSAGSIVHEILHAIGMRHEQTRWDRNQYVKIHWDNIQKEQRHNFNRLFFYTRSYTDFDFDSIMLYGPFSFAKDPNKPTITKADGSLYQVNRKEMSSLDIKTIEKMYQD